MKITYLKDYKKPNYFITNTYLKFELKEKYTLVTSTLKFITNKKNNNKLILVGEKLELISLKLNNKQIHNNQYNITDQNLTIKNLPEKFFLQIITRIFPQKNMSLDGLYKSSGNFCTQCEPEGFRKITYYLDRPDIMSIFTTKIIANKKKYPILLSNGNLIKKIDLNNNLHMAIWSDPFKKPSYLFALVAGNFACIENNYITISGKKIVIKFYVEYKNKDKCNYAIWSLQQSMKWDEDNFGLEYDLNTYIVVAISDFNMGAMENKGLNIFNTKYVLSDPKTSTDDDYRKILAVIGHEYFHNYTGNRITCRDWFQLSLKEGLTVFREQEFSSDLGSQDVNRINNIKLFRALQFVEDISPTAHSVIPESYIKIDNFYTSTIYNKGAEIIRMINTFIGKSGFRKGLDLYFKRHDGKAVTCDDFIASMSDANNFNLTQFKLWYYQIGTLTISIEEHYDIIKKTYTLKFKQKNSYISNQKHKKSFHMPVKIGLIDNKGNDLINKDTVIELKKKEEIFIFNNIKNKPIPSLFRDFSAPIKIDYKYSNKDYLHLFAYDSNNFNKWDAGQKIAIRIILSNIKRLKQNKKQVVNKSFINAIDKILSNKKLNNELKALLIKLPNEHSIAANMKIIDVENMHNAIEFLRKSIAIQLNEKLLKIYHSSLLSQKNETKKNIGDRLLANTILDYMASNKSKEIVKLCFKQFKNTDNMTNKIAALHILADFNCKEKIIALQEFYNDFNQNSLVIDKWFTIQALSKQKDTLINIKKLTKHKDFNIKNPNRLYSLIGTFCSNNIKEFHIISGASYIFLANQIIKLDTFNPQIAARLLSSLIMFRRYDKNRQILMINQLKRIKKCSKLSLNASEIINKSLDSE